MNGHAPTEHRTNNGSIMVVCECGWSTPPQGVMTFDEKKRKVSGLDGARDIVFREHGAHVGRVVSGRE